MQQFLSAKIKIFLFDSANHADLAMLQQYVPILVKFLHATTKGGVGSPSCRYCQWAAHTSWMCVGAPYSETPPASYLPPPESQLSFFHSFFFELGKESTLLTMWKNKRSDSCRKLSYCHPSLSPGIFCPHGICYGCEVIQSCESPRHPFEIFRRGFHTAPRVIIYDNPCKLHQYCLNREPNFFANTL